jgi:hypothetical protein
MHQQNPGDGADVNGVIAISYVRLRCVTHLKGISPWLFSAPKHDNQGFSRRPGSAKPWITPPENQTF